jgi:plasminogen activator
MRDWASPLTCAVMTCASLIAMPVASAVAGDLNLQPGIFSDPEYNPSITMGASVSHVSGSAHEYVFSNDGANTVSRLDWQIRDAKMLNASLGVRLTPWVSFELSGGTRISGESEMDDYDWLVKGRDWSHWSHSPQTELKDANRVDVSGNLSLFRHPNFTLDAVGGVRWNQWTFQAEGGHYIYTSDTKDPAKFRDLEGDFPDGVAGIQYKQNLITPYLGLQLNVMFERFDLQASVSASPFTAANNYDQHFMRYLQFHDIFHNASYVDYKFGGAWHYSDRVSITGSWEREAYGLAKGSTTISQIGYDGDLDAALVNGSGGALLAKYPGKSSGYENTTDRISLGLTYKLD